MIAVVRWFVAGCCCAVLTLPPSVVWAQAEPAPLPAAPEPSPLLTEPTTPEATFDTVLLLVELARFDLAKQYLQQFVDGQPTDDLLVSLRDKHGTSSFLLLTKIAELRDLAYPLLARLNAVSQRQAANPEFIDALITRLSGRTADRELAIRELRNSGAAAVPQMLRRLATAATPAERDAIVLALSRMGQPVVPAVIAGLDSPNEAVVLGGLEALQLMEATQAVPRLWSLAFGPGVKLGTRDQARRAIAKLLLGNEGRTDQLSDVVALRELRTRAHDLLSGRTSVVGEENSDPIVWNWSDEAQTVVATPMKSQGASLQEALRTARDAFQLEPSSPGLQTLYLTSLLASEIQRLGWDATLTTENNAAMQVAVAAGSAPLLDSLKYAMDIGRGDAAWAALQGLSALASPELLRSVDRGPSPVTAALNYPDPRVQFAAAMVTLRSDSANAFAGGGRVMEILRRALTDPGQARAIIVDPDQAEGAQLGTYLNEEGLQPVVVATGKEGFIKASEMSGVTLILVHANVARWPLTQTLANLRADARTAYLPIIVYGPEDLRSTVQRLINRTGRAIYVGEAPAAQSFWVQARPILTLGATPPLSGEQRDDFKALAAYWLSALASTPAAGSALKVDQAEDELLPLIYDPQLGPQALAALGRVGTRRVQSQLLEAVASQQTDAAVRQRAATTLASHIQRFGLLLSDEEVARLTSLWEAEEDAGVRAALAAAVGALQPNRGLVGERLQSLSAPAGSAAPVRD